MLHGGFWLAGTIAGMSFALALYQRRALGDAVLAHATTNGLIAVYVLTTGRWSVWSWRKGKGQKAKGKRNSSGGYMRGILWSDVVKRVSLGVLAAAVAMVAIESPLFAGRSERRCPRSTARRCRQASACWAPASCGCGRVGGRSRRGCRTV